MKELRTGYYDNGSKEYEDTYVNGVLHGKNTRWYESGRKEIEEHYLNGERHGIFTWWNKAGNVLKTSIFDNGTGVHYLFCESGQMLEKAQYVNGKKYGEETLWHKNGQKYRKYFLVNYKMHGKCIEWGENGQKLWEEWYDKTRYNVTTEAEFKTKYPEFYKEHYDENQMKSFEVKYYKNGQRKHIKCYVSGDLHDKCTYWFESGQIKHEGCFMNGMPHGKRMWCYSDGKTWLTEWCDMDKQTTEAAFKVKYPEFYREHYGETIIKTHKENK